MLVEVQFPRIIVSLVGVFGEARAVWVPSTLCLLVNSDIVSGEKSSSLAFYPLTTIIHRHWFMSCFIGCVVLLVLSWRHSKNPIKHYLATIQLASICPVLYHRKLLKQSAAGNQTPMVVMVVGMIVDRLLMGNCVAPALSMFHFIAKGCFYG
jgi:hypothetical protein